ncbi:M14 family metallopeptidase [Anaerolentibacter hominis]|uniref:succinylglutamate desuccinylase/aspartoacylase family protein n=1 Tax=Anaerolentibacter hominis TaxID=3079009 RepID=UPI0031B7EDD7
MEKKIFENFNLKEELKERNTKKMGWIPVAQRPNGSWIQIPIMIATGAKDGVTVLADGCNHGDEYEGPEAIADAFYKLDTSKMSGNFVGVPAVNIEAFAQMMRYNTTDFVPLDLNRIYPGSPAGPMTAYLCNFYTENVLKQVDALITIHGGGNCEYLEPVVLYCGEDGEIANTSREMAEAFGFNVLWKNMRYDAGSGIEDEHAYTLGIPAITPEIGGQCTRLNGLREENVARACQGILNVLTYFHVLEGETPKTEEQHHYDIDYIFNHHGGVHKPLKKQLDEVKKGDVLSEIYNVFGEKIDEVIAPFDGVVIGYWTYSVCQPHSWVYMVGKKMD